MALCRRHAKVAVLYKKYADPIYFKDWKTIQFVAVDNESTVA